MDSSISRKSDAAATRKRRSSILKSQRAPRTPFSELEFHVATPTDVAKSRRVSFSRRNGVAEFEITEATTAWKNLYEEHNKSLETSANEAGEKSEKDTGRRVEYLGCRITDVEFTDVDPGQDPLISSYNDGNAEYTNNDKSLLAPHINFELTEFTEHQTNQLFDNDTNPMIREITDQIDINFSAVAPLSDDLEIHDDLDQDRKATNMSCIDIDLNATHFSLKAEESGVSDMSITDSIHSPKVAAAKLAFENRKSNADDWVADKENIIVNPYVAPLPAENFAVNDDNDDVLVFDGKKCKFQSDITNKTIPSENAAVKPENSNKRRTIVYNNDQGDISVTQGVNAQIIATQEINTTTLNNRKSMNKTRNNDSNISMTQAVPGNILMSAQEKTKPEKERTIHFDDFADISMTQALPSNIFSQKLDEPRNTVVYETNEGHLSMTEVVPANVIPAVAELRKTILYENEDANISMTQAVPLNIQVEEPTEKRKTVDGNDAVDVPSAVPTTMLHEKRKTILFGNDTGNISVTQSIPTTLIIPEKKEIDKRKTIVYEDECGNLSVTQAVPANLILSDKPDGDKRKTIVYENNDGDMSVTEMVPNKVVIQEIQDRLQVLQDESVADTSLARAFEHTDVKNKRRTIVFNESQGNLSITQSLPDNIMVPAHVADKRKIMICQDEAADISVTETVPDNLQKSNAEYDISLNKIEPKEDVLESKHEGYSSLGHTSLNEVKMERTRISNVSETDKDVNMSMTEIISNRNNNTSNRNTTILDDKLGNLSMTKPIPAQIMLIQSVLEEQKEKNKGEVKLEETYVASNKSVIEPQDILIYEAAIQYTKAKEDDNERHIATGSNFMIESSSSKVSESTSDPTGSGTSGKIEVADDPKEDYDADLNPLVDVKNNTSAVSVIENRISSSPKRVKIEGVSVKESILNDLLDMSESGNEDPRENNNLMIQLTSDASSVTAKVTNERGSQESYLLIKDSDEEPADKTSGTSSEEIPALECPKLLPIEYQEEKHHGLVGKLQHKLSELKTFINQKSASKTKNVTVKSLDSDKVDEQEEIDKNGSMNRSICKPANKTENNADDTNALLDILSHFTDTRVSKDFGADDKKEASPLKIKGLIAIENKSEANDTRRSLVPDRKSMIRSREDLLKDISMAQAMIKFDDEQEDQMDESAEDTMIETQEISPPRRSPRLSHEVVKTLKFDEDDSMFDPEISSHQETHTTRHEMATSPLKKTAFGETTYIEDHIRDSKTKVIPGFLKDVSNDLKELMNDLVKPTNDPVPFETNLAKKSTSTHSTQIQANLLTSSQIDLDPDLQSNAHSAHSVEERLASEMAAVEKESVARTLQSQIINPDSHLKIPQRESEHLADPQKSFHSERRPVRKVQDPSRVIVFDHHNPLNNVLLPAIDQGEVHKYNPGVSESAESLAPKSSETTPESEPREKEEHHVVESRMALHDIVRPIGDSGPPAIAKQSFMSDTSKPMSLDESIDAKQEVKEVEVNTVIVMKGNRDLLEASSSLTLVDDALARSAYDVEIDSNSPQKKSRSPVQVIFKIKEPESSVKLDSDLTSNDDDMSEVQSKGKKRNYSPAQLDKNCTLATEEVTPKPASKVQKVSFIAKTKKILGISTKQHDRAAQAEADSSQDESSSPESDAPSEALEISKRKSKQAGAAITVQQLMTEYDMDTKIDQAALNREILAHLTAKAAKSEASCSTIGPTTLSNTEECKSLDVVSSFASSRKNFQSDPSDCEGLNSVASESRRAQWQPELMHEISSKNLVTECESSVNVVSKIDVLPFMGTTDCEWESRSTDCWSFRLLRARLRLVVRLRHRHGNAPRSRVRADTPVVLVAVEQPVMEYKKENPIATLCVKFGEEAMRYFIGRGCERAGSVPSLLRRCAGAARVAVRWGRAMHAARAHLAFTLTHDGALSLKVWGQCPRCCGTAQARRAWPCAGAAPCTRRARTSPSRSRTMARSRSRYGVSALAAAALRRRGARGRALGPRHARGARAPRLHAHARWRALAQGMGSVPSLLRHCAGAARVAVRWGRAMHAARAHLAFTLTHDGALSLKVANIPLRSVWEVTMQIELVVNDAREAPWPMAGGVRVARVVAEHAVGDAELARLLATVPRDWGHAPRAVWKIFKYLKRKTRDDELLLGL
ncbi:uncharacterized protein isoform X2 [Choristoneura fumiferana]|uniref:uncharacterized protein isoform X2 n=1 Tax=Choristoneura fumiferana TaxID=7141 RepID=UPI003D1550CA